MDETRQTKPNLAKKKGKEKVVERAKHIGGERRNFPARFFLFTYRVHLLLVISVVVVLCSLLDQPSPPYESSISTPGVRSGACHGLMERPWLAYAFAFSREDLHRLPLN